MTAGKLYLFKKAIYCYVQRSSSLSHSVSRGADFNSKDSASKTFEINLQIPIQCNEKRRSLFNQYIIRALYVPFLLRGLNDKSFTETKQGLQTLRKVYDYSLIKMLKAMRNIDKRYYKHCLCVIFRVDWICWKLLKAKAAKER